MRKGKEQADNILIFLDKDSINMVNLKNGILNAVKHDNNGKIKSVIILFKDGKFKILRREDIKNGV